MRKSALYVAGTFGLLWGLPPSLGPAATLYVADPATDCIYVQDLNAPSPSLSLLSGSVSFEARELRFLSATEEVFSGFTDGAIRLYDESDGTITQLFSPPSGFGLAALDTGPGSDAVSALYFDRANNKLVVYSLFRSAPGESWTAQDTGIEVLPAANGFKSGDKNVGILHLPNDRYVVAAAGGSGGDLFLCEAGFAPSATPLATLFYENHRLARSPGGNWIVWKAVYNTFYGPFAQVYDGDGTLLQTIDFGASDSVFERGTSTIVWNSSSPEVQAIARAGLYTEGDPAGGTHTASEVLSFLEPSGKLSPELNLGAADALRVTGNEWDVHDPLRGVVATIDASAGTVSRQYVLSAGSGPTIEGLAAITASDDGVFLLDGMPFRPRVLRIDPADGARTEVALLPVKPYHAALRALNNGQFMLFRRGDNTATPPGPVRNSHFIAEVVIPGVNPEDAVTSEVARVATTESALDWTIGNDGDARVLLAPRGDSFMLKQEGGSFAPAATVSESTTSLIEESLPASAYVGSVQFDSTPEYADVLVYAYYTTSGGTSPRVTLIGPDASEWTLPLDQIDPYVVHPGSQTLMKRLTGTISSSLPASADGVWQIRVENVGDPLNNITLAEAGIVLRTAPNAQRLAIGRLGTPVLYEARPPAIVLPNEATGAVTRQLISPPARTTAALDDLNWITDFTVSQNGPAAYIALRDRFEVYRVDTNTGSSSPVFLDRPAALDSDALGLEAAGGARLALSETLVPAAAKPGAWTRYR